MKMLDRYILRSFLMSALMWFVILMSLRIVVDLFVNVDEFAKLNSSFSAKVSDIVSYYGYHSFVYFIELGGIIISVSAAFTIAMMNHTNELTAMMASGVSLHRVAWPIIVCSMLLGGLIVVDEEMVVPRIADKLVLDKDNQPGTKEFAVRLMIDSPEVHCPSGQVVSGGSVWFSMEYSTTTQRLSRPAVIMRDKSYSAVGKITAQAALPASDIDGRNGWRFQDAVLMKMCDAPMTHCPDSRRVYTRLTPEQIILNSRDKNGNPIPLSAPAVVIRNVDLTDKVDNVTVKGRLEPEPPPDDPHKARGGTLYDCQFVFSTADGQELGVFRAAQAKWVPNKDEPYWELIDGDLFYATDLSPKELILRRSKDWVDYLSTHQLSDLLQLKRINNANAAMMTRHVRAVEPINNLIMLMLGLPFILSRERNLKASAGLCLLMAGMFYAFIYLCRYVGLPPDLAAWLPVLLFGPIASVTMYSVKT
jgi:lipopolysaccharide export LptBFGC system permease protein LptF